MAGSAVHVFDMLDVRELGAVCAAREFGVEGFRLNINQTLRVTDHAVAFHLRLLVETARRVADVTFWVRADGHGQSLLGRLVARLAFQVAREIGVRDFDPSQVRLVSEAVVVDRFLHRRRLDRGRRRFVARLLTRLLAARGERSDEDCETSQRERELHYFQPVCQGPDRFQHFSDSSSVYLVNAIAGARELLIHWVNAAILVIIQSARRGLDSRGSRRQYERHTKIWSAARPSHRGYRDHRGWLLVFLCSAPSVAQSGSWCARHIDSEFILCLARTPASAH